MTQDVGEAALAALATAFEAIGGGSTSWAQTKRPQVLRERVFERVPVTRPLIVLPGIIENCQRDTATNPARYKSVASIPVRLLVDAQTWNPAVDASSWKHDLKKAVGLSHTLGGNAFDLTIVSIGTGLPAPDQDQSIRITMDLSLEWFWSENDPATHIPGS